MPALRPMRPSDKLLQSPCSSLNHQQVAGIFQNKPISIFHEFLSHVSHRMALFYHESHIKSAKNYKK